MLKVLSAALILSASLLTASFIPVSTAHAEGGCGFGYHRGPYGGCRPNGAVVVLPGARIVVPAGPVVVAPRACPWGYHLGPYGHHCFPN